jgi:hypothetical protein
MHESSGKLEVAELKFEQNLDRLYAFRKQTYERILGHPVPDSLIAEKEWDQRSYHVGVFKQEQLTATVRISYEHNGKLPLSTQAEVPIEQRDTEVSRLLIAPEDQKTKVIIHLLKGVADFYRNKDLSILVDVVLDEHAPYGIHKRSYMWLGFKPTGFTYFDERYKKNSEILRANPDEVTAIIAKIDELWERAIK